MKPGGPDADELFELVDEQGRVTGRVTRARAHSDPSLIHRAAHVWVFRPDGRLVLQKRSQDKDLEPGKWDSSVGGHLQPGEDYLAAANREMKEELGIQVPGLELVHDFKYRSEEESEDVRTYACVYAGPLRPTPSEIEELREWTRAEIDRALDTGVLSRHFELEWRLRRGGQGRT